MRPIHSMIFGSLASLALVIGAPAFASTTGIAKPVAVALTAKEKGRTVAKLTKASASAAKPSFESSGQTKAKLATKAVTKKGKAAKSTTKKVTKTASTHCRDAKGHFASCSTSGVHKS